ncbi:hypothetical protein OG599_09355 [Streptomyces sp. NBC_01335]|uniref:hypothetical protein n=1 Tax=Streptomyces sp. NBC_01335 TaxID=2903828 RepID=UPI002E12A94E|nr:hypothetical protein OG599_09355 [Streptomyces sp. NBC_01335]
MTAALDWSAVEGPEVRRVVDLVARKFGREYGLALEADDARQESAVVLAEKADEAREMLAGGPGLLYRWLCQQLRNRWLTELRHQSRHLSYEASLNGAERGLL